MTKKELETLLELITKFVNWINELYLFQVMIFPISVIEYQVSNYEKLYGK